MRRIAFGHSMDSMKTDPLKQFVALRAQLTREKESLEQRLAEIHAALAALPGSGDRADARHRSGPKADASPEAKAPAASRKPARAVPAKASPPRPAARARKQPNGVSLRDAVLAAVRSKPLTRHEILKAVVAHGYRFRAKNPLNSLSAFLYMDKSVKNVDGRFSPA